jgi:hypothetical protein
MDVIELDHITKSFGKPNSPLINYQNIEKQDKFVVKTDIEYHPFT